MPPRLDWQTLFAGVAAGVALAAMLKQHFDGEARAKWEADQTTRRENFEKEQTILQLDWQRAQEARGQRERAEDIDRATAESTPNLRVTIVTGYRWWGQSTIPIYTASVENIGKVSVSVNDVVFRDPTGQSIYTIHETSVTSQNWLTANLSTHSLPAFLQPTQSLKVHWVREQLRNALREDHQGKVAVNAIAQDGAGTEYESENFIIDLNEAATE